MYFLGNSVCENSYCGGVINRSSLIFNNNNNIEIVLSYLRIYLKGLVNYELRLHIPFNILIEYY